MGSSLDLQVILEQIPGVEHVYFQPPESVRMEYPAIIYGHADYDKLSANNKAYKIDRRYSVTLVYNDFEMEEAVNALLALPYCSYDRHYVADQLHHDVFTLYY